MTRLRNPIDGPPERKIVRETEREREKREEEGGKEKARDRDRETLCSVDVFRFRERNSLTSGEESLAERRRSAGTKTTADRSGNN